MAKPRKLIKRDMSNALIGGVCSGIANYLNLDVSLVRMMWVIITVFTGVFPGAIIYLAWWAIVPEK